MKLLHIVHLGLGGSASVVFSLLNESKKNIFIIEQNILFTGGHLIKDYKRKFNNSLNNTSFIKTKILILGYLGLKYSLNYIVKNQI